MEDHLKLNLMKIIEMFGVNFSLRYILCKELLAWQETASLFLPAEFSLVFKCFAYILHNMLHAFHMSYMSLLKARGFMVYYVLSEFFTFPLVSWVRCGT